MLADSLGDLLPERELEALVDGLAPLDNDAVGVKEMDCEMDVDDDIVAVSECEPDAEGECVAL